MYPAGMLTNTKTGRFHPIIFRDAPMPGNADDAWAARRYKSLGHHTVGFDTLEEAQAHIKAEPRYWDSGAFWEWDGEDVPAIVHFFAMPRADAPATA